MSRRFGLPLSRAVPLLSPGPVLYRPRSFLFLSQTVFPYHPRIEHMLSPESGFPLLPQVRQQALCLSPRESGPILSPPPPRPVSAGAPLISIFRSPSDCPVSQQPPVLLGL